jgi:hypothetical protein
MEKIEVQVGDVYIVNHKTLLGNSQYVTVTRLGLSQVFVRYTSIEIAADSNYFYSDVDNFKMYGAWIKVR